MFVKSVFLSMFTNGLPILNTFLIKFHRNLTVERHEFISFWIPFWSKFLAYFVIFVGNFNIFLNPISTDKITSNFDNFLIKFTPDYSENLFICREDQSAYNMIIYVRILTFK